MRTVDLIEKKASGFALNEDEIRSSLKEVMA